MNGEYQCSIQSMFYDLSTALSILASSSANAWCNRQFSTSFYITRRYNMSDKYCFLCHLVPPKFEHLSENCIRTSKCLNNKPIFAIIAKRKTEGGGTWQFPCSKAMPFSRAAGQRLPPGLIRATRPCSVRSGRHCFIILLWICIVVEILAIASILILTHLPSVIVPLAGERLEKVRRLTSDHVQDVLVSQWQVAPGFAQCTNSFMEWGYLSHRDI